jgi:hypothetical protein
MPTNKERQKTRSFMYRQIAENFENLVRAFKAAVPDNETEKWQRQLLIGIYADLASLCRSRYRITRFFSRF